MRIRFPQTATAVVAGVAGVAGLVAGSAASASSPPADAATADCAAIAADIQSAEITTFVDAVNSSTGAIAESEPPFTVFIPLNSAFEAIPDSVLDSIFADDDMLAAILDYHVVPGQNLDIAALAEAGSAETLGGDSIEFALDGETLVLNGGQATVVCPDLTVDDALVHVIDSVLQPPSLGAGGSAGSSVPGSSTPGSSVPVLDPDQQAVATAWETATDSSLTFDDQAAFIENAEELRPTIEAYPTAADVVGGISTTVQSVAIDGDTAAITYSVSFNGVEQPYPAQDASLVLVDGSWIVPQTEICAVYSYARNACPA